MELLGPETPLPCFTRILQITRPRVTVPELWFVTAPSILLSLKHPIKIKGLVP